MNRIALRPRRALTLALIALMGFAPALSVPALASSHMDAPLITLDPPANTTDVYAFVSQDQSGNKFLTIALSVYPMENPGIGPNKYNFDGDPNQNLTQTYSVKKIDNRTGRATTLGRGIVPPNNQGNATPFYNQKDDGENPARKGVATADELDRYTRQSIFNFPRGYTAFAGQRDDGF